MATNERLAAFKQNLGARIDALEVALTNFDEDREAAVTTLRRIALSLKEQSAQLDQISIQEASEKVELADEGSLVGDVRDLIGLLRKRAGNKAGDDTVILVIGGKPEFFEQLGKTLDADNRSLLHAPSGADARRLLKEHAVACILMHVVLPDVDGRTLVTNLRENPRSASIPILLLADRIDDSLKEDSLLHASDGYIEKPRDIEKVADWINLRLRRAFRGAKETRRDALTGLLNRAAFRETFEHMRRDYSENDEPMALGAICVDSSRAVLSALDDSTREDILQSFGLLLSRSLRTSDIVARWGVYDFVALFPGENQQGGSRALAKIIDLLEDAPLSTPDGKPLTLNISAGVALAKPDETLDDIIASTDQFVYDATSRGGNQVVTDTSTGNDERSQRVLAMIQDAVTAKVLIQLFEKDGFEVTQFSTWDDAARDAIRNGHFHLVILDEMLPPTGGLDVLKTLRADSANSRLPIAMLIAKNAEESVSSALEFGANDYITRPFSPFTFISRMRRLLSRGFSGDTPAPGTCRILIIDDDLKALILAASALHQRGEFQVCLGKGADDGLARVREVNPTAIIVARTSKKADGTSVIQQLANDRVADKVDIIIAIEEHAGDLDPFPFEVKGTIKKPFNPTKMGSDIEAMLGLSPNPKQAAKTTDHLNSEIQRLMGVNKG